MATQPELSLPGPVASGTVAINARCMVRTEGEHRVVLVAGLPVHHYDAKDAVAEAYALVLLVDGGYATQKEVGVAFGCSARTVRRHQERYAEGGMTALATRAGWRPGRRRMLSKRGRIIERLRLDGLSNREIARRLGVTENAIRRQVGPAERAMHQELLPLPNPPRAAQPPRCRAARTDGDVLGRVDAPEHGGRCARAGAAAFTQRSGHRGAGAARDAHRRGPDQSGVGSLAGLLRSARRRGADVQRRPGGAGGRRALRRAGARRQRHLP